jgi:uncharacterized repeat protein (TIGR01451 family)
MVPPRFQFDRNLASQALIISVLAVGLLAAGCKSGGGGNGGGGNGGGGGPIFHITKTHQGNFTQGQQNATYSVTISNVGGNKDAVASTLMEQLPSGLTLVSMAGSGWACSTPTPPLCPIAREVTRSQAGRASHQSQSL